MIHQHNTTHRTYGLYPQNKALGLGQLVITPTTRSRELYLHTDSKHTTDLRMDLNSREKTPYFSLGCLLASSSSWSRRRCLAVFVFDLTQRSPTPSGGARSYRPSRTVWPGGGSLPEAVFTAEGGGLKKVCCMTRITKYIVQIVRSLGPRRSSVSGQAR